MIIHGFDRGCLPSYLKEHYFKSDNLNILEVGVLYAEYSSIIRESFKNSNLYLVDLWETKGNDFYYSTRDGVTEHAYEVAKSKFKNDKKCSILKGRSQDILEKFEDNFFNFIYIDGDHSYQGVKSDINICMQKLKHGGILAGHDWDPDPGMPESSQFGVNQALLEYFNNDLSKLNITNEIYFKSWFFQKV